MTDALPAGRELDALVGHKVIGLKDVLQRFVDHPTYTRVESNGEIYGVSVPHYSTDIAAAWQIIDHFYQEWFAVLEVSGVADGWHADIVNEHGSSCVTATTAPLAICLAALKMKEGFSKLGLSKEEIEAMKQRCQNSL